ncbi:unnamed protein product [Blepharisma stoltei]|uniref:Uncharacterized protein n=1 Tax=Blepharisma stoltei TaxID=1481888 RepID=A0AAU9ITN8_9CILI|nr:unnamed protein product [Blepharisma stoltei]
MSGSQLKIPLLKGFGSSDSKDTNEPKIGFPKPSMPSQNNPAPNPLLGLIQPPSANDPANKEIEMTAPSQFLTSLLFKQVPIASSKDEIKSIDTNLGIFHPIEKILDFRGTGIRRIQGSTQFLINSLEGGIAIYDNATKLVTTKAPKMLKSPIYSVIPKSDLSVLYTCSGDGLIRVLNYQNLNEISQFSGHNKDVTMMVLSPDEKWLYSGGKDATVRVWNLEDPNEKSLLYRHDREITVMDITDDGIYLATGGNDRVVRMYHTGEKEVKAALGPLGEVSSVKFSLLNTKIAAGGKDAIIKIWEMDSWNLLHVLSGHEQPVTGIAFLNNDEWLVSSSHDSTIKIWLIESNNYEISLSEHKGEINGLIADENNIYSIGKDWRLMVWPIPKTNKRSMLSGHETDITNILISSTRQQIFCFTSDNKVTVWNYITEEKVETIDMNFTAYTAAMTPDEKSIIGWTLDSRLGIYDITTKTTSFFELTEEILVSLIMISPDGSHIVIGEEASKAVKVYSFDTTLKLALKGSFSGHDVDLSCLAMTRDLIYLFSGDESGEIIKYDVRNIFSPPTINETKGEIAAKGTIEVVDTQFKLSGHHASISDMKISKDNTHMASGSYDKTIRVWNLAKNNCIKTIQHHTNRISSLYFTNNGEHLMATSLDNTVSIWNYSNYTLLTTFKFKKDCKMITCNADEKYLFIVEADEISVQQNPLTNQSFSIYGPVDNILRYYYYVKRILNEDPPKFEADMDKMVIMPMMMNTIHLYSYFNMPQHLSDGLSANGAFFNSAKKLNPLSLSVSRNYTECVNVILNNIGFLVKENPFIVAPIEDQLITLNERGYNTLDNLYYDLLTKVKNSDIPRYCTSNAPLPINFQSKIMIPSVGDFLGPEYFQYEQQSLAFEHTAVKIPMVLGSSESIKFLKSIVNSPNSEILRTKFIQFILEEKWKIIRWVMLCEALVYLGFLGLFAIYSLYFLNENTLIIPLVVINVVELFYEFYKIAVEGTQGWLKPSNYIGIFRCIIFLFYLYCIDYDKYRDLTPHLLVFLTFVAWIQGIGYFRLFEKTRYMIKLLKEVITDMISFMSLLFYSTLSFTLIFISVGAKSSDPFSMMLIKSYLLDLADFSYDSYETVEWIIFLIASILNPLIMLNLLISIIGDTFDRVQEGIVIADQKELCELIISGENLLFWRRNYNEKSYLQRCRVEEAVEEDEWGGKTREIKSAISEVQEILESSIEKNVATIAQIEEGISKVSSSMSMNQTMMSDGMTGKIIIMRDHINQRINRMNDEMNEKFELLEKEMHNKIYKVNNDIDVEHTELTDKITKETHDLYLNIRHFHKILHEKLDKMYAESNELITSVHEDLGNYLQKMNGELKDNLNYLNQNLNKIHEELNQKIDDSNAEIKEILAKLNEDMKNLAKDIAERVNEVHKEVNKNTQRIEEGNIITENMKNLLSEKIDKSQSHLSDILAKNNEDMRSLDHAMNEKINQVHSDVNKNSQKLDENKQLLESIGKLIDSKIESSNSKLIEILAKMTEEMKSIDKSTTEKINGIHLELNNHAEKIEANNQINDRLNSSISDLDVSIQKLIKESNSDIFGRQEKVSNQLSELSSELVTLAKSFKDKTESLELMIRNSETHNDESIRIHGEEVKQVINKLLEDSQVQFDQRVKQQEEELKAFIRESFENTKNESERGAHDKNEELRIFIQSSLKNMEKYSVESSNKQEKSIKEYIKNSLDTIESKNSERINKQEEDLKAYIQQSVEYLKDFNEGKIREQEEVLKKFIRESLGGDQ